MKAHQLDADGVIINTIVVDSLDFLPNLVDASLGGAIGDRVSGTHVVPALPPVVAIDSVPMLNLEQILIEDGKLAAVQEIIAGMTGDEGARARAYWVRAQTARRDNYLVERLWPLIGYDLAGFNAAWARAAVFNPDLN